MPEQSSKEPIIHTIFEPTTSTWQYIVADPATKHAAIIDSVLDYNPANATISTSSADNLLRIAKQNDYIISYILETHAHADHLTAATYIQQTLVRSGAPKPDICIGERITSVQHTFAQKYSVPEFEYDGVFDRLLKDGEALPLGELSIEVLWLPGHTPDHVGYIIGGNVFTGDSIFLPDVGSARCDFPGGDATQLFSSIQRLFSFPPTYKLYSGHDYPPNKGEERGEPRAYATIAEHREKNKHVHDGVKAEEFVKWRQERDGSLGEPRLLHQALQFNIRAGRLPAKTEHGHRFVRVPLRLDEAAWDAVAHTQG